MKELFYEIKIYGLFKTIKYAYQRVIKGYDERIKWGFDSYFNQFIPVLKEFCEEELEKNRMEWINKDRAQIYLETLEKIKAFEENKEIRYNLVQADLWEYVGKHIDWYWN